MDVLSRSEDEIVALVDEFADRLRAVDGFAHGPVSRSEAVTVALELAGPPGLYLSWDELGVEGAEAFAAAGWSRSTHQVPSQGRHAVLEPMTQIRLGLTGADGAIARSGSIALRSGPGRPRMASLIPLIHIAFLRTALIHPSLADLRLRSFDPVGSSNVVLITGPSRTGDIEQQLNLGVHGPKQLHVILVE